MRGMTAKWTWAEYLTPVGVLFALAALVRTHGQLPYPDARFDYGDHYRYIAMAQGSVGLLAHEAPFCWRVLAPLLVRLLPVSTLAGFWAVTLAGLVGATLALEWFLRGLGLPLGATIAGGLAFVVLGPAAGFSLWAYSYADAVPLCLLILALACAVHRQGLWLLVVCVLGALAKETILLGALFALAWAWSRRDRMMLAWSGGALVAVCAVLVMLRALIPSAIPYSPLAKFVFVYIPASFSPQSVPLILGVVYGRLLSALVGTWGALLPVAALQLRHAPRTWLRQPAYALLLLGATAQILVAEDVERLVAYGAPAIIAASCFELETLAKRWGISRWILWLPVLAIQLYWWLPFAGWPLPTHAYVSLGLLDWPHRVLGSLIFALAAAALALWLRKPRPRSRALQTA